MKLIPVLSENWVLEIRLARTQATRTMTKPRYRYEITNPAIALFFVGSGLDEFRAWRSETCPRGMERIAVTTPVKQRMVRGNDAMARTNDAVARADPCDLD